MSDPQSRPFNLGNRRIIDQLSGSQPFELARDFAGIDAGKMRNGLDVDVIRIEENPAVGRIRARIVGPLAEQHVKRVKSDTRGAQTGHRPDHSRQVGEIAQTPISSRPQGIELDCDDPAFAPLALPGSGGVK